MTSMDQPSRPCCPHCGRQDCGTAEQIPGWTISCDDTTTYNLDGSYTIRRGTEHEFGGFARDREDLLLDDLIEAQQRVKDLETEAQRLQGILATAAEGYGLGAMCCRTLAGLDRGAQDVASQVANGAVHRLRADLDAARAEVQRLLRINQHLADNTAEAATRANNHACKTVDLEREVIRLKAALDDANADILATQAAHSFTAGERDYFRGRAKTMQQVLLQAVRDRSALGWPQCGDAAGEPIK